MAQPLSAARHKPLSQVVSDRLRQAILEGHLKPGQRLRQEDLATQLGVSRMPVREALHRLVKEGLVEWKPHRGAVVKRPALRELQITFEALRIIQRTALELAVKRFTDEGIAALSEIQETFRRKAFSPAPDPIELGDLNRRFHRTLIGACGLPKVREFVESLWDWNLQAVRAASLSRGTAVIAEHDEILDAARRRDLRKLLDASDRHLTSGYEELLRLLSPQLEGKG